MAERDEGEEKIVGGENSKLIRARGQKMVAPGEKLSLWSHTVGGRPPAHELHFEPDETFTPPPRHSLWRPRRRAALVFRTALMAVVIVAAGICVVSVYRLQQTSYRPLQSQQMRALGSPVPLELAQRRAVEPALAGSGSGPIASAATLPSPGIGLELLPARPPPVRVGKPSPLPPGQKADRHRPPSGAPANPDYELLNSEIGRP